MWVFLLAVAVAFYVAFSIGANSETLATTVGSGVFSMRKAILLSAVFAFLGAVLLSKGVVETVGSKIIPEEELLANKEVLLLIGIVVASWLTFSTWKRIPISTTHSLLGAMIGVALAKSLTLLWETVIKVLVSAVLSPLLSFLLAIILYALIVEKFLKPSKGLWKREGREFAFGIFQVVSACLVAISFGANDVSKAIGILFPFSPGRSLLFAQVLGGLGIALGIFLLSPRVLRTVGKEITFLIPSYGFIVEISSAISILLFTFLAMPVSVSHTLVGATLGIGVARRHVNLSIVKPVILNWVFTIPLTMLSSFLLSLLL